MKRTISLVLINVFFVAILSQVTPYFFTKNNLIIILDNMAIEAILLSAYIILLIGGNFDLSVDGVVSSTGVIAGLLIVNEIQWILAIAIALSFSILVGLVNGYVVIRAGINGLIATLTTWWICVGLTLGITKGLSPYGFPEMFQMFGQARLFNFRILVFYALIIVAVLSIVLHFTKIGAHIYSAGSNKISAELMGIPVNKIGIRSYLLMSFLAGLVGLMLASRMNAASVMAIDGTTLKVIAAAVIGGCSLKGGKGTIINGLLGLLLMSILGNSIIHLGVSPYWQKAVMGSILLLAVLSEKVKGARNA